MEVQPSGLLFPDAGISLFSFPRWHFHEPALDVDQMNGGEDERKNERRPGKRNNRNVPGRCLSLSQYVETGESLQCVYTDSRRCTDVCVCFRWLLHLMKFQANVNARILLAVMASRRWWLCVSVYPFYNRQLTVRQMCVLSGKLPGFRNNISNCQLTFWTWVIPPISSDLLCTLYLLGSISSQ